MDLNTSKSSADLAATSYVLSIPLQPLEDMQSFSTSSPLRINKHTLIL